MEALIIHLSVKIAIFLLIPATALGTFARLNNGPSDEIKIRITGHINKQLLEKFKQMPSDVRVIEITSQGGDTESALEIARLIRKKGYNLEVTKYCLSACAQWLMPAATSVTINDNAIVAMHMTATWMRDTLRKSGNPPGAEKYSKLADKEAIFYRDMGVSPDMLIYPYIGKQAICYVSDRRLAGEYPTVASKFKHVILRKETYIRLTGQQILGEWPDDLAQISESITKNIPPTVKLSLALEAKRPNFTIPPIDNVPRCTDKQIELGNKE